MKTNLFPVILVSLMLILSILAACTPAPLSVEPPPPAPEAPPAETVPAAPPPKLGPVFETTALAITPSTVDTGSRVTIQVTITNKGDESGSNNVTLQINGEAKDTASVSLAPGASQVISFYRSEYTSRTYSVSVDNLSGSYYVKSPPPPPPPPPQVVTPPPSTPAAPATKDVSWAELRAFLLSDNATIPLKTSATASGIKVGKAALTLRTRTMTLNAFSTTDYGVIFVDDYKVEGSYAVWSVDVPTQFFRGLPLTQLDIRFYKDQAWWSKLTSAWGVTYTDPSTSRKIWDCPTQVNVTW